jgi:hypothetical protein
MRRELFLILLRASAFVRRLVAGLLLALIYVLVVPWYALWTRVAARRRSGWSSRRDAEVATLQRLRRPY